MRFFSFSCLELEVLSLSTLEYRKGDQTKRKAGVSEKLRGALCLQLCD